MYRYATLLNASLTIILLILFYLILLPPDSIGEPLFGFGSYIYIGIMIFTLKFGLSVPRLRSNPLYLLLTLHMLLFYFSRIIILSFYPEGILFQHFLHIDSTDVYITTRHLMVSIVFLVGGLYISSKRYPTDAVSIEGLSKFKRTVPLKGLIAASAIVLSINTIIQLVLGYFGLSTTSMPQWIMRFVGTEWVIILALLLLLEQGDKRVRKLAILLIISYITLRTYVGSRSAIYWLVLFYIIINTIVYGDFKIRRKVLAGLVPVTFAGIFLFILGTYIRLVRGYDFDLGIAEILFQSKSLIASLLLSVSERFSEFDSAIVARTRQSPLTEEYYKLSNVLMSAVNTMIPGGDIFEGKVLMHRLYKYIFWGYGFEESLNTYNSQQLTPFGEFYQYFGLFGCYIALFISSVTYQYMYHKAFISRTKYRIIILIFILYTYEFFLVGFGLDYLMNLAVGLTSSMVAYLIISYILFEKVGLTGVSRHDLTASQS